jgi:hypothetical protein
MSKKSRQRNKKILAAIGIGLGAAAMASKRKSDCVRHGTEELVKEVYSYTKTHADSLPKKEQ